jgi:hypothetical protein
MRAFFLFMPFYTPPDPDRAAELLYCLDRNLASGLFARIVLMTDDDTPLPRADRRLLLLRLERQPTYLDWVRAARKACPGHIAVLMNSDVYAEDSLGRIATIFDRDPQAFVALTRFDKAGDAVTPHKSPHWSQDCWALVPGADAPAPHDDRLDIPLGVPRCDNKIAYRFATQGHAVYNPFPFVRTIHVHETEKRYYSKTGDERVIGTVAYVHPGASLDAPARLDFDVWTVNSQQIQTVKVNRALERWREEARIAALPRPTWVAHDADWQYPAITEQHAFQRMRDLLPAERPGFAAVYLAAPFATLIDLLGSFGEGHARTRPLAEAIAGVAARARGYARVVSVCQHIRARQFAHIFAAAGVTDLFWSHATLGETAFPEAPGMRVHPFPLYPVQQVPRDETDWDRPRRWLWSFVGARSHPKYLTEVRALIVDLLAADPRGKVVARDEWHYQKIVYDAQIRGRTPDEAARQASADNAEEFRAILDDSVFSLCPSGTGPNSIRLWEAMVNGSIPVILADTWAAPGDPALWDAATLRIPETPAALATLPDRLAALAADPGRLRAMREALALLTRRYGPEGFVGDVIEAMDIGPQAG